MQNRAFMPSGMESPMADNVKFTHKELLDLARKVGALHPFLSDKETEMLMAIFASSVGKVGVTKPGRGTLPSTTATLDKKLEAALAGKEPSLSELQRQLLHAYAPGGQEGPGGLSAKIAGINPGG
jgi:hypothetical protein